SMPLSGVVPRIATSIPGHARSTHACETFLLTHIARCMAVDGESPAAHHRSLFTVPTERTKRESCIVDIVCFAPMLLPAIHLAAISHDQSHLAENFPLFLYLSYPLWVIVWGIGAWRWRGRPLTGRAALLLLFPFAAALAGAFSPPILSDDLYRYIWEGKVILSGHNPFVEAPDSAALPSLAEKYPEVHRHVNHPEFAAIYPPVAQLLF